ncbi:MAG: aldo/keto reductase, partial [Myxococcales bacterium]|nr:aldo/keto reductase [Myxococcales bacterium]
GTDRIDLFYVHRFDEHTALEDTLRTLDDLVRQGKILYPALSNFAAWETVKAIGICERLGLVKPVCIQPMYNLAKRQAEVELLPMAAAERLAVFPYSPLGGGLLSGKYGAERRPLTGRLLSNKMYQVRYGDPQNYAIAQAFTALAAVQLPTRLEDYLRFELPQSLGFELTIGSDGSVLIDLRLPEDQPLCALWPVMAGSTPLLIGLRLRGFGTGELLSAQLVPVEIDVQIDLFDPVSLALVAALPDTGVLADPRDLACTLTLERLWTVTSYQSGAPIPVPLFCSDLGFDYRGIEGLEIGAHLSFPRPADDPGALSALLFALLDFIVCRDALLDPANAPAGVDLTLGVGPLFLRTPALLGGTTLGSPTPLIELSAWAEIAGMLNWLKTLELTELLQAIPVDARSGRQALSALGVDVDGAWALEVADTDLALTFTGSFSCSIVDDWRAALALTPNWPSKLALVFDIRGAPMPATELALHGQLSLDLEQSPPLALGGEATVKLVAGERTVALPSDPLPTDLPALIEALLSADAAESTGDDAATTGDDAVVADSVASGAEEPPAPTWALSGELIRDEQGRVIEVRLPDIELPDIEFPDMEYPAFVLPKVKLPKVKLPKVKLPKVKLGKG